MGFPLPGVRVRIAEFKTSLDGSKVYYDILAEGNSKATKVEPGKVKNLFYPYYNSIITIMKMVDSRSGWTTR